MGVACTRADCKTESRRQERAWSDLGTWRLMPWSQSRQTWLELGCAQMASRGPKFPWLLLFTELEFPARRRCNSTAATPSTGIPGAVHIEALVWSAAWVFLASSWELQAPGLFLFPEALAGAPFYQCPRASELVVTPFTALPQPQGTCTGSLGRFPTMKLSKCFRTAPNMSQSCCPGPRDAHAGLSFYAAQKEQHLALQDWQLASSHRWAVQG